ncbi:hypothetical protein PASE110613_17665 [Paenibacillus sediminis]|uniref:F0F1-type ATP synthase assembly protein I n=1 Tax=Paenibacillus sediminis TaxID=664909 RepID=A0ABS4H2S9_9BACL|nr:F0F1-type ATP synthase assembly protein I [Paenibacillus sediminis]
MIYLKFLIPVILVLIAFVIGGLSKLITRENGIRYILLGIQLTVLGVAAIMLWAFEFRDEDLLVISGSALNLLGICLTITTIIKCK